MYTRSKKSGFTLVEILIVVIILGILAAIVIPQFTNASQDARKSSLTSQLQMLRSQIQLYKLQHGDVVPDIETSWAALDATSTYNGVTYGPYIQADPKNALNGLGNVVDSSGSTQPASNASAGFTYDYNSGNGTGRIWGTDTTGVAPYVEP